MTIEVGDSVIVADAEGVEHQATALSAVETRGHNFPVVWVAFDDRTWDRVPWPVESVRAVST